MEFIVVAIIIVFIFWLYKKSFQAGMSVATEKYQENDIFVSLIVKWWNDSGERKLAHIGMKAKTPNITNEIVREITLIFREEIINEPQYLLLPTSVKSLIDSDEFMKNFFLDIWHNKYPSSQENLEDINMTKYHWMAANALGLCSSDNKPIESSNQEFEQRYTAWKNK